nr:hypothetical protein [Clostridia bacterium]
SYAENGVLQEITVSAQNSYSNKKREEEYTYDSINRPVTRKTTFDTSFPRWITEELTYEKGADDPLADGAIQKYDFKFGNVLVASTENTTNSYNLLTKKEIDFKGTPFIKSITYDKTRVKKYTVEYDVEPRWVLADYEYEYDSLGRIVSVDETAPGSPHPIVYRYDSYGQLVREDNENVGSFFDYTYDSHGNITKVISYDSATVSQKENISFEYDSADRLISYNGKSITYNSLGCITSYDSKNYNWTKGKLSSIIKGKLTDALPYEDCFFAYNGYGQRTRKSCRKDDKLDVSYTCDTGYTYDSSGRLIREFYEESHQSGYTYTIELIYVYDESGIIGVLFSDNGAAHKAYYYVRNLHGDVISVHNEHYTKVAEYAYDAYGNCIVTNQTDSTFANYNPIRYRGYYYDRETKLYHVGARYYSSEFRRWISPDTTEYLDPQSVNGLNLYCYCGNDPVNRYDPSGHAWDWVLDVASVAWSLFDFIKKPSWENAGWLALDVVLGIIPFVPAIGKGLKGLSKVDDIVDIGKGVNRLDDVHDAIVIGNGMDRVKDAARIYDAAYYGGYGPLNALVDAGKFSEASVKMKLLARVDNAKWLFKNVFAGAKIIDIGKDGRNIVKWFISAYGMERRLLFYWWHGGHTITRLIRLF